MITMRWHATVRGDVCCWDPSICSMRCWVWWSTSEMLLHKCIQHEEQRRRARSLASIPELQYHYHKWNLMERVLWLVHYNVTGFSEVADRAGVVALYVIEGLDCMELSFGNNKVDSLLVRLRDEQIKEILLRKLILYLPSGMKTLMNYSLKS